MSAMQTAVLQSRCAHFPSARCTRPAGASWPIAFADACRSTEFWMERANMCGGAGYRNAQRSELLAEHFKKATDIGRESTLLG
jgi:hypothetical protein